MWYLARVGDVWDSILPYPSYPASSKLSTQNRIKSATALTHLHFSRVSRLGKESNALNRQEGPVCTYAMNSGFANIYTSSIAGNCSGWVWTVDTSTVRPSPPPARPSCPARVGFADHGHAHAHANDRSDRFSLSPAEPEAVANATAVSKTHVDSCC